MDSFLDLLDLLWIFISSQWWHLKCWSHTQHKYTYKWPFFLLAETELNVSPVICLIHYLFMRIIAKTLQGAFLGLVPWLVVSNKMYTDHIPAVRYKALCWEKGCLDVSRAPPLSDDRYLSVTVWLYDWPCEIETERSSGGILPCCLLTTLLLKRAKKTSKKKKTREKCSQCLPFVQLMLWRCTAIVLNVLIRGELCKYGV